MNSDAREAALGLLGLLSPTNIAPPQPIIPLKRKQSNNYLAPPLPVPVPVQVPDESQFNPDAINCICGFLYDDGFSIACDDCSRWCHAACFDIVEGEVPEEWRCWVCVPRGVDREKAVKLQKGRQKAAREVEQRRLSPGAERKPRRASAAAIDGGKRKRRASIINTNTNDDDDELVNIEEPWTHSYVPITTDIIPQRETRDKLTRQAQHWRGVTAIAPPVTVTPLPSYSVRPPSYSLHTTTPIPSSHLITPYTSTITSTSSYLSDPLNAYAHLGMPKPFVHLLGHPLDVTLDARITGDKARFVRSGCRPNAVLRPVMCEGAERLSFGVFALRDLKAQEEVILGWEWDDGNAIHSLPTLIQDPHTFP